MSTTTLPCLNKVAKFLQVPIKNLSLNNDKMPTCNINNKSTTGFINIIVNLVKTCKKDLLGKNLEEECEVHQWLEYCAVYSSYVNNTQATNQMLQEMNSFMELRTYFIGNQLTIADVVIYYMIQDLMGNLTYQQKEKYLNISRWFDNIQQNNEIRNKNLHVDFSTLFLTSVSVK